MDKQYGYGRGGGGGYGGRGMGGGFGMGAGGLCYCPNCGNRVPHARGQPCYQTRCPNCGAMMTRDMGQSSGGAMQPPMNAPGVVSGPYTFPRSPAGNVVSGSQTAQRQKPYVDDELCIGCGDCINQCPFHVIEMVDGKARIILEQCRHCGVCVSACPQGAIIY